MPPDGTLSSQITDASIPAIAIEGQLVRLLESPLFSHSRRYPGFLRYVVEVTLKGEQDHLKERSIGIDVFHRTPNYDLNMDPVVRVTAGEVRKRLAQYYYEPEHRDELRIELRPGSYIPEFKLSQENLPDRSVRSSPIPSSTISEKTAPPMLRDAVSVAAPSTSLPSISSVRSHAPATQRWWALGIGAGLLTLILPALIYSMTNRRSALDEFWQPALKGSTPVTISVGSWGTQSPTSANLSIGTHAESVSPVALADTITIANLQQFLSERSRATVIQVSSQTSFSDLQRGTTVLVSAFDNRWTQRLTSPLRFHFVSHDDNILAIEDRNDPHRTDWQIDQNIPYASLTRDYGIIARFHDPTTEQMIIVAAGIGENGTIAAGEMLTNPQFFDSDPNGGWNPAARNFEAVIETEVIDGKSGPPRIVAVTTW